MLAAAVFLYHELRGIAPWLDEWSWITGRRGSSISTLLSPHNQHFSLVPVAIYKVLLATVGIGDYRPYRCRYVRDQGATTAGALAALDLGRHNIPAPYRPTGLPGYPLVALTAGQYLAAETSLGTPAASLPQLLGLPEAARAAAGAELAMIDALSPQGRGTVTRSDVAPTLEVVNGGTARTRRGCQVFRPSTFSAAGAAPANLAVTLPPGGISIRLSGGSAQLGAPRFALQFAKLGTLAAGHTVAVRPRHDLAPEPWHLQLSPTGSATICGLAP